MDSTKIKARVEFETSEAEAGVKRTASAFDTLGKHIQKSGTDLENVTRKLTIQKQALEILQRELSTTTEKYKEGSVQVDKKKLAIERLKLSIDNLTKSQSTAGDSADAFTKKFMQGAMLGAGAKAFDLLSDTALSFGKNLLKVGTEYEDAMNMMKATSSATADQMDQISQKAMQLGADLTLPATSAGGATQAMVELSQAGLSVQNSMDAAKGTLQLAAAAHISEAEAARYNAAALNAFNLEGTEATRISDMYAASIKASGTSTGEAGAALQQAAAVYAEAKIPVEDLMTAINEMGRAGIRGSDAGTSLKTMLQKLQNPTKEAAGELNNLGVSIYDAQGAMLPMRDIIAQFEGGLHGLTQQQKDSAMTTIFGSDAIRAANIVMAGGVQKFDEMKVAVTEHGVAAVLAAAQTQGLSGAFEGLISQGETLALKVLTPLMPIAASVVRAFASIVGVVGDNLVPAFAALSTALIAYTLHANAAAIVTGGGLVVSLKASVVAAYASATAFAAVAIPIAAMAVAVGAIALVVKDFYNDLDQMSQAGLANRDSFVAATAAVEAYKNSTDKGLKKALQDEAQELHNINKLYEEKYKRATGTGGIGNAFMSLFDSDEVTQRQIAELKDLAKQQESSTKKLEDGTKAHQRHAAQIDRQMDKYDRFESGVNTLTKAFVVSEDAMKESEKALDKLADAGPKAMGEFLAVTSKFEAERESSARDHEAKIKKIKDEIAKGGTEDQIARLQEQLAAEVQHYGESEQAAAEHYVAAEAANRASLGRMFIDWINAMAMQNEQFAEKSGELVQFAADKYGIVASESELAWGASLNSFRAYADGTITDLGELDRELDSHIKKTQETNASVAEMETEKITKLRIEYERTGDLDTYLKGLQEVRSEVRTRLELDSEAAVGQAAKAQDQYDRVDRTINTEIRAEAGVGMTQAAKAQAQYARVERKLNTEIKADNSKAITGANGASSAFGKVPREVLTKFVVATASAIAGATSAGKDYSSGFAKGITSGAFLVAAAAAGVGRAAIEAGRKAIRAQSPGVEPEEKIGLPFSQGIAEGVKKGQKTATSAVTKLINEMMKKYHDVQQEYADYKRDMEALNKDHADNLLAIWSDYYEQLEEQTNAFNSNKFDTQLDFEDRISELDSATRNAALQKQQEAWDESQRMAQDGRAAEAEAYYEASLKEIEADTERAEKINAINEDIAEKKRELAEETDAATRASMEAELAELEKRKAYLEELDRKRDKRAAEELERLRNEDSKIAEERDKALVDENTAYSKAQEKLASDFEMAVDKILTAENRVVDGTNDMARNLVEAYDKISLAANNAAESSANAANRGNKDNGTAPVAEGAAGGIREVLRDNVPTRLHMGEEVLSAKERLAKKDLFDSVRRLASASGKSSLPADTRSPVDTGNDQGNNAPLVGEVHLHNDLDLQVLLHQLQTLLKNKKK